MLGGCVCAVHARVTTVVAFVRSRAIFLCPGSTTYKPPRRPFEKERLDNELKMLGEYGLKSKREIWRVSLVLAKLRKAARHLLTLPERDAKRVFDGNAILRRCQRLGVLAMEQPTLDHVLSLKTSDFMERRLQTKCFKMGLAKSIHHARVLIKQRHIRVGKQIVNIPSFMVRVDSEKHIDFALNSPFGGGREGRNKRKSLKAKAKKSGGEDGEEEDED